jgi:hypothetical protein
MKEAREERDVSVALPHGSSQEILNFIERAELFARGTSEQKPVSGPTVRKIGGLTLNDAERPFSKSKELRGTRISSCRSVLYVQHPDREG